MGKRGPPKKPTELLELDGSWLAKNRGGEPNAEGNLECPDWLSTKAKDFWKYVVPLLESMKTVGTIDSIALARYCNISVQYIACTEFIEKHGWYMPIKNKKGEVTGVRTWPHVGYAKVYADQLRQLEMQFGMTPASRPDVNVLPVRKETKGEKSTQDIISGLLE